MILKQTKIIFKPKFTGSDFMRALKKTFHQVITKEQTAYGGNQAWFPYGFLRKNGCGVISASDVLLHLHGKESMTEEAYIAFAKNLWLHYLPVIPGFGMNGLTLMTGLNLYFTKQRLPYRACWRISSGKMISHIDKMLGKDIPVILSVGPNFPKFWGKQKLNFYTKINDKYIPSTKICAHFVTVTGRDGAYLKIASWGKEYYIDIREYREYVRSYSSYLVSNILVICKK